VTSSQTLSFLACARRGELLSQSFDGFFTLIGLHRAKP
jgi:hypothetical protein